MTHILSSSAPGPSGGHSASHRRRACSVVADAGSWDNLRSLGVSEHPSLAPGASPASRSASSWALQFNHYLNDTNNPCGWPYRLHHGNTSSTCLPPMSPVLTLGRRLVGGGHSVSSAVIATEFLHNPVVFRCCGVYALFIVHLELFTQLRTDISALLA